MTVMSFLPPHCNHTATHCNTLGRAATHCNTPSFILIDGATLCNTLQHTTPRCNTLNHAATHSVSAILSEFWCIQRESRSDATAEEKSLFVTSLQHTATQYTTLQHTHFQWYCLKSDHITETQYVAAWCSGDGWRLLFILFWGFFQYTTLSL